MPYASGRVIHDADAHIMEVPGFLEEHLEARHRAAVTDSRPVPAPRGLSQHALQGRSRARSSTKAQIMLRKNWEALGSSSRQDRPRSVDLLGFASQLMFTTALLNYSSVLEGGRDVELTYAVARAHTRHMVEFCSVDRRLLPTGYVPLVDFERTERAAREGDRARRQGADDPVALPRRPFAEPYRLRSAVGHRPGGRPADRFPCRRWRQAAGGGLLQQRPAAGARLPWRRRQFQVDRLHGHRLSADEGADGAGRRPRARPLPAPQVRRHRTGRLVGAGLDAQHGQRAQRLLSQRGAAAEDVAEAQRVRAAPGSRHALPARGCGLDHRQHRRRGLPLLVRLSACRGRPPSHQALRGVDGEGQHHGGAEAALLLRQFHRPDGRRTAPELRHPVQAAA